MSMDLERRKKKKEVLAYENIKNTTEDTIIKCQLRCLIENP